MKPAYLFVPLVLLVLCLTGCESTINRAGQMRPGMSRAEVIKTLGDPYQTLSPRPEEEILRYDLKKQRLYRLAVPITTEYMVRLINGQVIAYGAERDLMRLERRPVVVQEAPKNEKTININVRTEGQGTNTVAPIQPRLDLNAESSDPRK